jgi:hypothetical protein
MTADHWTFTYCWTLREILGIDGDLEETTIDWMVISTFIIDFDFLLEEGTSLISKRIIKRAKMVIP